MFQAFIIGGGRRYTADTLESIIKQIRRDHIDIPYPEQMRAEKMLHNRPEIVVHGHRKMSHNEKLQWHIRHPFQHIPDKKDVFVRIIRRIRKEQVI